MSPWQKVVSAQPTSAPSCALIARWASGAHRKKAVVLIPQFVVVEADPIHGDGNVDEMLEELAGQLLIARIIHGQFQSDGQHIETEHRPPARPICLLDGPASWERGAAVEHPDVIQSKKSAFEKILARFILAVHPPGKVHEQFVELAFQKGTILDAAVRLLQQIDLPDRLAVHRRIDIAEIPLVGGNLSVGMKI